MKKILFSVVMPLLVMLLVASCGDKAESLHGVTVEQDRFSVVVPDGWSQEETGEGNYFNLNLTKNDAKLVFHAFDNKTETPADLMQKTCRTQHGWQYQADKELGDNTWNVAYAPNSDAKYAPRYQVFTALKQRGVLSVKLENVNMDDEEILQILESVEVK